MSYFLMTGVDAVAALLALVLAPWPLGQLPSAALQLLLTPGLDLVSRLSSAPLMSVSTGGFCLQSAYVCAYTL